MSEERFHSGDTVRVHPRDRPELAAPATVLLISDNGRAIAVAFEDKPPFPLSPRGGMLVHPGYGIVLMATRVPGSEDQWQPVSDIEPVVIAAAAPKVV